MRFTGHVIIKVLLLGGNRRSPTPLSHAEQQTEEEKRAKSYEIRLVSCVAFVGN
ncbi:MAG: hypothetical protein BJ554DRAFT_5171 [Olpidium bornovanus]|uniref:Uncharacterized protein n=1 Tax=Olpidium bornovanus TaxID=278681 RepID=A0A8H8DE10_9FUNG|nr:MAG: hypothetical protein BJ554DRAFT_5171 [Olpidium bornovanus]